MNTAPMSNRYNGIINLISKAKGRVKILENCFDKDGNKTKEVIIQGRIISINSNHFTVQKKNGNKQCFLYADLVNKRYKLEVI